MRVTFFCFAKRKSPKKRRPPVCDPFAVRRGKPAAGRLRGAPWNSLCAARAARTATASQITKHGRFDAHATPQPPRRRRSQQGVGQPNIQKSTLAIAALGRACAARGACAREMGPSEAMARMDVRRVPFCMRLGAQGAGWHARRSARASWTDSPQLSERSAAGAQRVLRCTPWPSTPGCPVAQRRGRRQQGRPFFGDFLSARRKKVTAPPGAHPGLRPQPKHAIQTSTPRLRQAQPERSL